MIHLYDTRWATYELDGSIRPMTPAEKARAEHPIPRYWVSEDDVARKLAGKWDHDWFLGWRDICRSTDVRTLITTKLPRVAVGNKVPLMLPQVSNAHASGLQAALASFACDFVTRQKMGGTTLNFFILMQLPVPTPAMIRDAGDPTGWATDWLANFVDRLNGWIVDPRSRSEVRAELDAALFHVYGLSRDEVKYVMTTFPIVRREDEAVYGCYRTKDLILTAYDAMAEARESGNTYRSPWTTEVPS